LFILAEYMDKKISGMLKCVEIEPICINQGGGYCFLDSLLKQYNGSIIETVIKNDVGFPNENVVSTTDLIILENGKSVDNSFTKLLKDKEIITDKTNYNIFTDLKIQDMNYIFKSIEKTKIIAFETQLMDHNQINNYIKFFLSLNDKKTVYIKTTNKNTLIEHSEFETVNNKHEIRFI